MSFIISDKEQNVKLSIPNRDFHDILGKALENGWTGKVDVDPEYPNENYTILDHDAFVRAIKSADGVDEKFIKLCETADEVYARQ